MKKCLSDFAVDRLSISEAAFQLRHQQACLVLMFHCSVSDQVPSDMEVFE